MAWVIVPSGQLLVGAEVKLALEDLATKERVDENEDEHKESDPDEVHESTLDDTNDHRHRLEGAKNSCYSQDAECTEHAHRSKGLKVASPTASTDFLHDHLDNRNEDDATIEKIELLAHILFHSSSQQFHCKLNDEDPSKDLVHQFQILFDLLVDVIRLHSHTNCIDEHT